MVNNPLTNSKTSLVKLAAMLKEGHFTQASMSRRWRSHHQGWHGEDVWGDDAFKMLATKTAIGQEPCRR